MPRERLEVWAMRHLVLGFVLPCVAPASLCAQAHAIGAARRASALVAVAMASDGEIAPNDNRRPAGVRRDGVLTVALEARIGVWEPDGPDGPRLRVAAFAESGGALRAPGPLLRAPAGTEVRATVRNALADTLFVHGLGAQRGLVADTLVVAPGTTAEARFRVITPGTYYYAGRTRPTRGPWGRSPDDLQLNGALVVDPAGAPPADDRVFVITEWFTIDTTTVSGLGANATLAFNGRSWPATERIEMVQGDTARWRFVNTSQLEHPLHLHGAYFRIDAKGDGVRDTTYAAAERRLAVTELVLPGQTMALAWSPVHSGNWLLHCHFASH